MAKRDSPWEYLLVIAEIFLITVLNYKVTGTYYSVDVLYCLPIIQATRLSAIRALRRSDTQLPVIIGTFVALAWSLVEFAAIYPDFPLAALVLNILARSVTLTVVGRVVAKLWREREFARKDALTGLANRVEFLERFEAEQARSKRSQHPYSVLFVDVDQFKKLNDQHGHHIGDDALRVVADILLENSRNTDTVARFGGDEFMVLATETDAPACATLIRRIQAAAEKSFKARGWEIALSIGQATATGNHRSIEDVLREADSSMYSVKHATRGLAELGTTPANHGS